MKMNLDPRIQDLIHSFQQELEGLLQSHKAKPGSEALTTTTTTHGQRQRYPDVSDLEAESAGNGGQKTPSSDLMSKLSRISELTKEVSTALNRSPRTLEIVAADSVQEGGEGEDDYLTAPVVVLGPPGTEPKKGVSEGRFDRQGSVVYSRSSIEVAIPQHQSLSRIKVTHQKDFVRRSPEVVEVEKREEDFGDRPWTRSGTKMLTQSAKAVTKSPYVEESDSSDLESDEDSLLNPLLEKKQRVSGKKAGPRVPQVKAAANETSQADDDSDTTTDSRVPCSTSGEVSEYETAPSDLPSEEEEVVPKIKALVPHLPTPVTITAGTLSHDRSPRPLPSHTPTPAVVQLPPPSGLLTVLKDLQNSYGGQGRPRPKSAPRAAPRAGTSARSEVASTLLTATKTWETFAEKAAKSTKAGIAPCSVDVKRLSPDTVEKYLGKGKVPRREDSPLTSTDLLLDSPPSVDFSELMDYDSPLSPPSVLTSSDYDSKLAVVTAKSSLPPHSPGGSSKKQDERREDAEKDKMGGGGVTGELCSAKAEKDENKRSTSRSLTPTLYMVGRKKRSTPAKPSLGGHSARRRLSLPKSCSSDSDFEDRHSPSRTTPPTSKADVSAVRLKKDSPEKRRGQDVGASKDRKEIKGRKQTAARKDRDKSLAGTSLPEAIDCTACGRKIQWKKEQIHEHGRLKVLVCQECWTKYNTGAFVLENGSEIYCTLCGDGGSVVCCDECEKSCCEDCIARVSGRKLLRKLLRDEDAVWKCYVCSPAPLAESKRTCEILLDYYQKRKESKSTSMRTRLKYLASGGGSLTSNSELSDRSSSSSVSDVGRVTMEDVQPHNLPRSSSSSGDGGIGLTTGSAQGGQQEGGRSVAAGESGGGGGRGGRGRKQRGGKKSDSGGSKSGKSPTKAVKERRGGRGSLGNGDFESSSSGSAGDESPEVHTDEVSMSDSDMFEEDVKFRKKRNRKKGHVRRAGGTETASSVALKGKAVAGEDTLESGSGRALKKPSVKNKRSNLRWGRVQTSGNSSSDFETPTSSQRARKCQLLAPASEEEAEDSRGGKQRRSRKSKLASAVSSDSESGGERDQQPLFLMEEGKDSDSSSDEAFSGNTPRSTSSKAVKYESQNGIVDSSDSEIGFVERRRPRKKRQRHTLGSEESGSKSTSNSASGEKPPKNKKTRRGKGKGKLIEENSDDDFAPNLSLIGPKVTRRNRKRALLWSSSSGSESDAKEDKEEEEKREESSGKEEEEKDKDVTAEDESPSKGQKRKKLRKLISNAKLAVSTKEAQSKEKERRERLEKLKKKVGKDSEDADQLVLEMDPDTKEVKVEVRRSLLPRMKPHQRQGTKFLYEACVESLERFKSGEETGAILAHCMGLGKTLQVISFVDALLNHKDSGVSRVLILSPVNTIHNWKNEFDLWLPYNNDYHLFLLVDQTVSQRMHKLRRWFEGGGIVFAGYEMFRNLVLSKRIKGKRKGLIKEFLLDPGPDIIVCDEGHVMRNSKSNLTIALNQVRTRCRIILTGTPLQNNLLEYYTMVDFVKPNLLGTLREFTNRFANPIKNGQCRDSTPYDVRKMKHMAHVLHSLLAATVQRRDYRVLADCLPPKQEYVLSIGLSPVQDQLYRRFLDKNSGEHTASDLFTTFSNLSKVWNHPWVLKLSAARQAEKEEREALFEETDDETLGGFIVSEGSDVEEERERMTRTKNKKEPSDDKSSVPSSSQLPSDTSNPRDDTPTSGNAIIIIDSSSDESSNDRDTEWNPVQLVDASCVIKSEPAVILPDSTMGPGPSSSNGAGATLAGGGNGHKNVRKSRSRSDTPSPSQWFQDILTDDYEGQMELSGKLCFLFELLREAEKLKEKVLVFTQSLLTLDLIEEFLSKEENGDWTPGLDYYRLDGSTKPELRAWQMQEFNEVDNNRMRLFLISTRAGSLGVNLVAANRVVIFDACWNPSHDLQAIFRTYRYGQTKPIFVYRLLARGTMEEKIYDRQVTKQSLSLRVVDEMQIGRHFTANDLAELFTYSPPPVPPPPYDRPKADLVLGTILDKLQPQWIAGYHEHDSLLEHVYDEELPEEERKAAWESYKDQMAAESMKYNYNALQSRLDEEQASRLQQATSTAPYGINFSAANSTTILNAIMMGIQHTRKLQILFQKNQLLKQQIELNSRTGNSVVGMEVELKSNNSQLTNLYTTVATVIKQVNELLERCTMGHIILDPGIHQRVHSLREQLLSELNNFKIMTSQPQNTLQRLTTQQAQQPMMIGGMPRAMVRVPGQQTITSTSALLNQIRSQAQGIAPRPIPPQPPIAMATISHGQAHHQHPHSRPQ